MPQSCRNLHPVQQAGYHDLGQSSKVTSSERYSVITLSYVFKVPPEYTFSHTHTWSYSLFTLLCFIVFWACITINIVLSVLYREIVSWEWRTCGFIDYSNLRTQDTKYNLKFLLNEWILLIFLIENTHSSKFLLTSSLYALLCVNIHFLNLFLTTNQGVGPISLRKIRRTEIKLLA